MSAPAPVTRAEKVIATNADKESVAHLQSSVAKATAMGTRMTQRIGRAVVARTDYEPIIVEEFNRIEQLLAESMAISYASGVLFVRSLLPDDLDPFALSRNAVAQRRRKVAKRLRLNPDEMDGLVKGFGSEAKKSTERTRLMMSRKVNKTLEKAFADGLTTKQAVVELQRTFDALGVTPRNKGTLETIFRTQSQLAFAAGEQEELSRPEVAGIHWGYKYVTVGDDRVRPKHAALEGVTLPKNNPFWKRNMPPNGWNCRCKAIPIFGERETTTALPEDAFDPGFGADLTRAQARIGIADRAVMQSVQNQIVRVQARATSTAVKIDKINKRIAELDSQIRFKRLDVQTAKVKEEIKKLEKARRAQLRNLKKLTDDPVVPPPPPPKPKPVVKPKPSPKGTKVVTGLPDTIDELLVLLDQTTDKKLKSRIRAKLRKLGHKGGSRLKPVKPKPQPKIKPKPGPKPKDPLDPPPKPVGDPVEIIKQEAKVKQLKDELRHWKELLKTNPKSLVLQLAVEGAEKRLKTAERKLFKLKTGKAAPKAKPKPKPKPKVNPKTSGNALDSFNKKFDGRKDLDKKVAELQARKKKSGGNRFSRYDDPEREAKFELSFAERKVKEARNELAVARKRGDSKRIVRAQKNLAKQKQELTKVQNEVQRALHSLDNSNDVYDFGSRNKAVSVKINVHPKGDRDPVDKAVVWLNKNFKKRVTAKPTINVEGRQIRAYYQDSNKSIHLSAKDRPKIAVHEMGHALESANPDVERAIRLFMKRRLKKTKYPRINTDRGERLWRDDFEQSYTGRVYLPFGQERAIRGGTFMTDEIIDRLRASEILSMGLEAMYNDPGVFARSDPEFAKFILGIMDGSIP